MRCCGQYEGNEVVMVVSLMRYYGHIGSDAVAIGILCSRMRVVWCDIGTLTLRMYMCVWQ